MVSHSTLLTQGMKSMNNNRFCIPAKSQVQASRIQCFKCIYFDKIEHLHMKQQQNWENANEPSQETGQTNAAIIFFDICCNGLIFFKKIIVTVYCEVLRTPR